MKNIKKLLYVAMIATFGSVQASLHYNATQVDHLRGQVSHYVGIINSLIQKNSAGVKKMNKIVKKHPIARNYLYLHNAINLDAHLMYAYYVLYNLNTNPSVTNFTTKRNNKLYNTSKFLEPYNGNLAHYLQTLANINFNPWFEYNQKETMEEYYDKAKSLYQQFLKAKLGKVALKHEIAKYATDAGMDMLAGAGDMVAAELTAGNYDGPFGLYHAKAYHLSVDNLQATLKKNINRLNDQIAKNHSQVTQLQNKVKSNPYKKYYEKLYTAVSDHITYLRASFIMQAFGRGVSASRFGYVRNEEIFLIGTNIAKESSDLGSFLQGIANSGFKSPKLTSDQQQQINSLENYLHTVAQERDNARKETLHEEAHHEFERFRHFF